MYKLLETGQEPVAVAWAPGIWSWQSRLPRLILRCERYQDFPMSYATQLCFQACWGTVFEYRRYGFTMHADPQAKTVIRRCREEIVLEEV